MWYDLAEITTWSVKDTEAALHQAIPLGWEFVHQIGLDQQYFGVIYDSARVERWHSESPDFQLLLLAAYGWLFLRSHPEVKDGLWAVRKQELTAEIVQKHALNIPDPEDLVPEELETFYHLSGEFKNGG